MNLATSALLVIDLQNEYRTAAAWLVVGYDAVLDNAAGLTTRPVHRTGLLDMANRLYGGGILRMPEALKALAGQSFDAWRCARPVEFAYTLETVDRLYEAL
jgi:maleamate amidohydrolase